MHRQDRRRYFRINDWVGLSYRPVSLQLDREARSEGDNVQISSAQLLDTIDKELAEALNLLWRNSPAVANVLGLLNKKMNFLASGMALDYLPGETVTHEQAHVNISACGIAFGCDESFKAGELLELQLLLKPANTRLQVKGRVNACEKARAGRGKPYFLRLDFVDIQTQVQEELIQHIVRRQSVQLNAQLQQAPGAA